MSEVIYGIQQSQPVDVANYLKSRARKLTPITNIALRSHVVLSPPASLSAGVYLVIDEAYSFNNRRLLDGRYLRYAEINAWIFGLGIGNDAFKLNTGKQELRDLGYSELSDVQNITNASVLSAATGYPLNDLNNAGFQYAYQIKFLAGTGTIYGGDASPVLDAPADGNEYVRVNNSWQIVGGGGAVEMGGVMTSSIIPDTNAAYDLGSAEYKIRHLYLSDTTIYTDSGKLSVGVSGEEQTGGDKIVNSAELKSIAEASTSFEDFKTRIVNHNF